MLKKIKKWFDKITGKIYYLPKEYRTHTSSEKPDESTTIDPFYEKKEKKVKHPKTLSSSWN